MNLKKKRLYTLLSLLIVIALAVPVWSTVVMADDAIEIHDWQDLHNIRNNLSGSYILVNDLDLTTPGYDDLACPAAHGGKGWQPIGVLGDGFTGSFDGQGHEIRDLFIDRDDEDGVGLFGALDAGGVIMNVGVVSVDVTGAMGVGGLVGDNWGGTVINSYATGSVVGDSYVGGLAGWNAATVSNCYSSATVTGNDTAGGLVGSSGGVVEYSYSSGIVTGDSFVGGLVGDNFEGLVSNAHSSSTVFGGSDVGGLAGFNDGTVSNCHATGDVVGEEYVGGLIGVSHLAMVLEAALGGSTAVDQDTGGQARGRSTDGVESCSDATTRGDPEPSAPMGGDGGAVSNCYSTGSVHGDDFIGGLLGFNTGTVCDSYATGSVIGDYYVGGLVGENGGTVSRSYATGSVSAAVHRAGGLVGVNYLGTVTDSYASGSVSGSSMVGGLVGENYQGWVSYSYSTGSVSGGDMVGGLVGENYEGSVTSCFWDTETSGTDHSDGGVGRTTEQMKSFATFNGAGWDITAIAYGEADDGYIWNIIHTQTYPFLSWEGPVEVPGAIIEGQTREVNCEILPGVTVTAYLDGVERASVVSDGDGNYSLVVPEYGEYELVASKAGFREWTRTVWVDEVTTQTFDFIGDHGLIPNHPDMSYVLQCMNLRLYGEPPCQLSMSRVLAVMNARLYPITEG